MRRILLQGSALALVLSASTGAVAAQTAPAASAPAAPPAPIGIAPPVDAATGADPAQTADSTGAPVGASTSDQGDIVVTGFRRSLDNAARIKRNSDIVSDVISAEDIGQFPDQNLAESLQRITGVQITRSGGEGSGVSIRGLPSEFTRVQYNGRTVGSGGTRSFDFTAFSALFTSAVEVQKSTTPDMIDGGLSGTVNVRSARPLDIKRTTLSASVEGVYEENRGRVAPRVAVLGNWVNDAGTFGINGGIAFERRDLQTKQLLTYGSETSREAPLFGANGAAIAGGKSPPVDYNRDGDTNDTYSFTHATDYWNFNTRRDRLTGILGYQWKASDQIELYGDGFYSKLTSDSTIQRAQLRFTDLAPQVPGGTNYGVRSSTITTDYNALLPGGSQGFLERADVDGLSTQAIARGDYAKIEVKSVAQGIKFNSGRFAIQGEGSYFEATNRTRTFGLAAQGRASAEISYPDGIGTSPTIDFTRGYDQLNGDNFYLTNEDIQQFSTRDRNYEGRLDATYDVGNGFLRAIKVGGYYGNRKFVSTSSFAVLDANQIAALSNGKLTVTPGIEGSGGIAAGSFLSEGNFSGVTNAPRLLVVDLAKFNQIIPQSAYFDDQVLTEQPGSGFNVTERTLAAYARADFKAGDDRLSGNIGVRYVNTRTISRGISPNLDGLIVEVDKVTTTVPTAAPTEVKAQYGLFLPSFNARFNITDAFLVRFAAARVIGRPGLGDLSAGTSVDANVRNINSGNPSLTPYKSDQLDLSFEYYLPRGGLFSLAGFYKHLSDYILSGQTTDIRTVALRSGGTATLEFRRNQPLNLATGDLKGVEVAAQLPFSYLADALNGAGFFGSYTYIDAPKFPRTQGGTPFTLDGVAKNNFTAGAYIEKFGAGLRGSYTYRGQFTSGSGYFGDGGFTRAYGQFDGSIDYKISDKITATVDVTNLLDAKTYSDNSIGLITQQNFTGRRFTGGVRFKL